MRDVRTKARKSFVSTFFPVGDNIEQIVGAWIDELTTTHHFGPDDPLFPATLVGLDEQGQFAPIGIKRTGWANAASIRKIFKVHKACSGQELANIDQPKVALEPTFDCMLWRLACDF